MGELHVFTEPSQSSSAKPLPQFEGYQAVKEELEQRDRENASKSIVEDWDTIGENPNSPRPSTTALNSSIQKIPSQPFIGSEEITAHLGQVVHSQQRVRDR